MSVDKKDLIDTRAYRPEDKNFIFASWLRGLYYGNSWFNEIPKNIFMAKYHMMLENILASPGVNISVACLKDDPEVILGYSVGRTVAGKAVLDWVFVKTAWREIGIGKSLMPKDLHAVTHLTKVGKEVKPANVIFNPFI